MISGQSSPKSHSFRSATRMGLVLAGLWLLSPDLLYAQEFTDAISREISVFNNTLGTVEITDANGREASIFNNILGNVEITDANGRESSIFNNILGNVQITDSNGREFSVLNLSGLIITDAAAHYHDAGFSGSPPYATACALGGLQVDGRTHYGTVIDAPDLRVQALTVEGYVKWSGQFGASGTVSTIVDKYSPSHNYGKSWILAVDKATSKLYAQVFYDASGNAVTATDPDPLPANACTHVAFTVDAAAIKLYVNGVMKVQASWSGKQINYAAEQNIGFADRADHTAPWIGILDDFRMSNSARTSFPTGNAQHEVDANTLALWRFNTPDTPPETTILRGPSEGANLIASDVTFSWIGQDTWTPVGDLVYSWRLDTGGWSGFAADTSHAFIGLSEGVHQFTVKARDTDAQEDPTPAVRNFTLDRTAPTTSITQGPREGGWSQSAVTFGWLGLDQLTPTGQLKYSYHMDGASWSAFSDSTGRTWAGLSVGAHQLELKAKDLAGNIQSPPLQIHFTVDITPPQTTISLGPADSAWVMVSTVPLAWHGSDTQAQAESLTYATRLDNGFYTGYSSSTIDTLRNLTEGIHRFRVRAKDPAGNVDLTPDSLAFFVDALAPVVNFVSGPSAGAYLAADSAAFVWTAVDVITHRSGLVFSSMLDSVATSWGADTSRVLRGLPEGLHTLAARARDAHDHMGLSQRSFTVDLTPPETEITSGPADSAWATASSVSFGFRGSDNISLPAAVRFSWRLDGGGWSAFASGTSVQLTSLSAGWHTFEVKSRDQALHEDPTPAHRVFRVGLVDLAVTSITAPDSTLFDTTFTLSFAVTNLQQGPATGMWYDRVYVSPDSFPGNDTQIAEFARVRELNGSQGYEQTHPVTVPWLTTDGTYWLIVKTDARGQVNEEDGETNNTRASRPVKLMTPAHPDLQAVSIVHPSEAWAGQPCLITFRIRNQGTAAATGTWREKILISSDAVAGGDRQLATFQYPYGLPAGGEYEHTHEVVIPPEYSGNKWMVVTTDCDGQIREYTGESNNSYASPDPLYVNSLQYPNLVVDAVSGPSGPVLAGERTDVEWTVRNASNAVATNVPLWSDRVYLSPTPQLIPGVATSLGTFPNPAYLPPGESYHPPQQVTMPSDIAGSFYLIVQTDVNRQEDEGAHEGDNVGTSDSLVTIRLERPFLRVLSVQPPEFAWSGQEISVRWVVANAGQATFTRNSWDDGLVLSRDAAYGPEDTLLATGFYHSTPLARDETDTLTATVRLPENMSGMLHLFVVPNVRILDNVHGLAASDSIEVTPSPPPDLYAQALSVPAESLATGAPVVVSYMVRNEGPGIVAVPEWKDALYLSPDTLLDEHDTPLALITEHQLLPADSSYTRQTTVSIPSSLWGTYYLLLATDVEGRVAEGVDGWRNTRSLGPLQVYLSPPDLQVTQAGPAAPAASGRPILLRWRVGNLGMGTTAPDAWFDDLYLSDDAVLSTPGDRFIERRRHQGALAPSGSYGDSLLWAVPDTISGPHYLLVRTDAGGEISEYNGEGNNTTAGALPIDLSAACDLQVTTVQPRTELWSGSQARIRWTVANLGPGGTYTSSWKDALYLSSDSLISSDDALLIDRQHEGALDPAGGYADSATVILPVNRPGAGWLIVETDRFQQVYERGNEGNNTRKAGVIVQLTPPPDLQVTAFSAVGQAWSGASLPLRWTVTNSGDGATPNDSWQDGIYLSADSTFNLAQDALVATFDRSALLSAHGHYDASDSLALPQGMSGTIYLFAFADRDSVVYEHGNEGNNTRPLKVEVHLTPPPDLAVTSLTIPAQPTATANSQIQWTVQNQGAGGTLVADWQDRVYLSDNSTLEPADRLLLVQEHSGALAVGQGYLETHSVVFPAESVGSKYLIVQTDALDRVYERLNEGNNVLVRPISIAAAPPTPPDLAVDSLVVGVIFKRGEKTFADVHWRVRNVGEYPPPPAQNYWSDGVFLSADSLYDPNDVLLGAFSRTGGLKPDSSYARSATVHFPDGVSGQRVLLCVTDYLDQVAEISSANNLKAAGALVSLNKVDLKVTGVWTDSVGTSGQYLPVRWTVVNDSSGRTETSSWTDAVYLSRDGMVDETDVLLGTKVHTGLLGPSASYTDSMEVQIPLGYSGAYFLLVQTDKNNEVSEYQAEGNNVGRTLEKSVIVIPTPADLVVAEVSVPANGTGGRPIEVNWTVGNIVANPASGRWTDAVYISADSTWSADDLLLGQVEHQGGLGPGKTYYGTYSGVLPTNLPGLLPGHYRAVVRTDIKNNINESNEANNERGSAGALEADVTELRPGVPQADSIRADQSQFFHLSLDPRTDARVHLIASGPYDDLELYVGYGYVPDRIHYAGRYEANNGLTVIIPGGGGNGYLLLYGRYVPGASTYELQIEGLPFGVASVEPSILGNAGLATVTLRGGGLDSVSTVRLARQGQSPLEAWRIRARSSAELEASFDFRDLSPGSYDVEAITSQPDTARLAQGLRVTTGRGSSIIVTVDGATSTRTNCQNDYVITLRNDGDADAYDVLTPLIMTSGAHYQLVNGDSAMTQRVSDGTRILCSVREVRAGRSAQYALRIRSSQDVSFNAMAIENVPLLVAGPARFRSAAPTLAGERSGELVAVASYLHDLTNAFCDSVAVYGHSVSRSGLWSAFVDSLLLLSADRSAVLQQDAVRAALAAAAPAVAGPGLPSSVLNAGIEAAERRLRAFVQSAVVASLKNTSLIIRVVRATDPNEKLGPNGRDDAFVSVDQAVPFSVFFENVSAATAPARQVRITDQLDGRWDWRRFRLTEFAFGGVSIPVPEGYSYYHTNYQLPSGHVLEIDAGINLTTGLAHWYFTTIDPATGQPTNDPVQGFLPPNVAEEQGQGHVGYTIQASVDLPSGTEVPNSSVIRFDENNAITTNTVRCVIRDSYADLAPTEMHVQTALIPPIEGDPVTLTAAVENLGEKSADSVAVGFYAGHPDSGGVALAAPIWIATLAAGRRAELTVNWNPVRLLGPQRIYTMVDRGNRIQEKDEGNNVWLTVLDLGSRSASIALASDLNLVALPLDPGSAYNAQNFSSDLGATLLIRADSTGNFRAFVPDDPLSPRFPVVPGVAYMAFVPQARTAVIQGMTSLGVVTVHRGTNMASLPLQQGDPYYARDFAGALNASSVIRYDAAAHRFRPFLPGFHTGAGFEIEGGRGYVVLARRDTTVVFPGKVWVMDAGQSGLFASAGAPDSSLVVPCAGAVDDDAAATVVLGITGTLRRQAQGGDAPLDAEVPIEIRNARTGVRVSARAAAGTGHFDGAFVDFSGGMAARAGDRLVVRLAGADSTGRGESASDDSLGYIVTRADAERRYARIDGSLLVRLPSSTLMEAVRPNPVFKEAAILYQLASPVWVNLDLFSVDGRRLSRLIDGKQKAGFYGLRWSGTDGQGHPLASGVYFLRFRAGSFQRNQKLVIAR